DIFNTRFLNFKSNLFLPTRTAELRLIIKESELYPLYFIVDKPISTFKIVESVAGTSLSFNHIGKGVYALDIETLRYRFFSENHVIANVFDLFIDSEHSCRIIIEQSDLSKERYRLKFRNSLGVFEILELTGSLSINPDYSGSEDSVFQRYDSLTGSFYSERERIARSQCISVETGVKRPDEVRFLMDAIGSEEVYLLDVASFPIKVIPSIEEFAYIPRPQSPERFTLKLKIAESETNIMQDVIDGAESEKPQIFSNHFTNQFN
ncbi:MAG: hypothetical protein K2M14_03385, partial [Muribaculaceae bacterium]|nr:hypothetical protein [Muribaculaceae bacterium]